MSGRSIAGATELLNLIPHNLRLQRRSAERSKRPRVGNGGSQRGSGKSAHRRLNDRMRNAEAFDEIRTRPRNTLKQLITPARQRRFDRNCHFHTPLQPTNQWPDFAGLVCCTGFGNIDDQSVDLPPTGFLHDAAAPDDARLDVPSICSCACAREMNSRKKQSSQMSFIRSSPDVGSICSGIAASTQTASRLNGLQPGLRSGGTVSRPRYRTAALLTDLGDRERSIVKILAVLIFFQATSCMRDAP